MTLTVLIALGMGGVLVALWLGLRVQPKPLPPYPERTPPLTLVPLPGDLPEPVTRFYRRIGADGELPEIETAVISLRGMVRVAGVPFPSRSRFTHQAGQGYRHYIEATWFGLTLLRVNEWYLDGHARLELPFGTTEDEAKVDLAANLGLWGESIWLPSIFVTDGRVRWRTADDLHARLIVPSPAGEDEFSVTFDRQSGLISRMQANRYKQTGDPEKTPWFLEPLGWSKFNGLLIPTPASATWQDEASPWLVITVEDLVYNVDVHEYIRAVGP